MKKSNIVTGPYNGLEIQTDEANGLWCRRDMLDTMHALFQATAFQHRTFFMRFDVRFPVDKQYPKDNNIFKAFMANFIKHLSRHQLNPYYMWCRERTNQERNQHYHCLLLLNGYKTQSIYGHLKKAEELWARALGLFPEENTGLIDYCDRGSNGVMVEKGDMIAANYCFYWASYLAKVNFKENLPGIRDWGTSQIY